ncbi:MAG TPA: hypothetical protein VMW70_07315 [Burkholderiales bacterium]|nr:hypothetical protein [Burkholderiales bacterium]
MILNRLGLVTSAPLMAFAIIGSTVAQEGAVLLHEQNYSETVGVGDANSPVFRQFYVAAENSPRWDRISRDISVAPFQTPQPGDARSGPFILDTTAPDRSEFASRILDSHSETGNDGPRLYLGLATASDDLDMKNPVFPELSIGTLDAPVTGSTLSFVRFDINEWEITDGVLSYDIDVSYWGKPATGAMGARAPKTLMAMGSIH